jgi:hypothetical protein
MLIIKNLMEDITHCFGLKPEEDTKPLHFSGQASLFRHWLSPSSPAVIQLQPFTHNNVPCKRNPQIEGIYQNHGASNLRFNILACSVPPPQGQEDCFQSLAAKGNHSCSSPSDDNSSIEFLEMRGAARNQAVGMKSASSDSIGPKMAKKQPLHRVIRKIEETPDYMQASNRYLQIDWAKVTDEDFQLFATGSLLSSTALQNFISKQQDISFIENLSVSCFEKIIFDQFGCQVLRSVLKNSPKLITAIREFLSSDSFPDICTHQFASKVIQTAAEIDESTRHLVINRIIDHWDSVKQTLSTLYLFRIFLYKAQNTDAIFLRLSNFIFSRCQKIFDDKYEKRFLAVFVEYCSRKQLAMIYKLAAMELALQRRGTDRYVVLTFLAFIHRRYKKAEDFLIHLLHQKRAGYPVLRKLLLQSINQLRSSVFHQLSPLLQLNPLQ